MLLRRYGEAFSERLNTMFEEAGLPHAAELDKVPNSRRALALGELARERNVYESLHPRLFDAYWVRGLDLGDDDVLASEAAAVGIEADDVRAATVNPAYLGEIAAQTEAALDLGVGGVPAWVIDERVLIPGAQPHEVFEQVLERLGHEPLQV